MNAPIMHSRVVPSATTCLSVDEVGKPASSRAPLARAVSPAVASKPGGSQPTFRQASSKPKVLDYRGTLHLLELLGILRVSLDASHKITGCFVDAYEFLGCLPAGIPAPSIWSDGECEVVFEWIGLRDHAVVSLEGDGILGYTYRRDGVFVPGEDSIAKAKSLPKDLRSYLESFA